MFADAVMLAHPKIEIVTWQMFVELTSQSKLKFIVRADSHLCLEKQRGCPLRGSHIFPESPLDETTHLCFSLLDIHGKDQVWVQRHSGEPRRTPFNPAARLLAPPGASLLPMLCPCPPNPCCTIVPSQPMMLSAQSLSYLGVMHWCQQAASQANMPYVYAHMQRGLGKEHGNIWWHLMAYGDIGKVWPKV